MNKQDLTGKRFTRLTVIKQNGVKNQKQVWLCRCDCGKEINVSTSSLNYGNSKSCGCIGSEKTILRSTKHGLCHSNIYKVWSAMRQRCNNENSKDYYLYGAKGIKVCKDWEDDFMSFYNWSIENGYDEKLTIDRIDNDKGYYPENCRWADLKTQANNQKRIKKYTYKGVTDTITYLSEMFNVRKETVRNRVMRGYTIDQAIEMSLWGKRNGNL